MLSKGKSSKHVAYESKAFDCSGNVILNVSMFEPKPDTLSIYDATAQYYDGDMVYNPAKEQVYMYLDGEFKPMVTHERWADLADRPDVKRITHPLTCECCGAPLSSNVCEYCGVEYT